MKAAKSPHSKLAESAVELRPAPKAPIGRTRRSVSIAPPQARRGIECDQSEVLCLRRLRRTTSGIITRMGERGCAS